VIVTADPHLGTLYTDIGCDLRSQVAYERAEALDGNSGWTIVDVGHDIRDQLVYSVLVTDVGPDIRDQEASRI